MASTQKVVIFDILAPLGFLVIATLLPRINVTVAYFCSNVIPKIIERMAFNQANSTRQLILHMDDATQHRFRQSITCLEKSRIRPIDHPPYSPYLAPSDFYLFGNLKAALAGQDSSPQKNSFWRSDGSLILSGGPCSNWFLTPGNGD
jgi:histone-lysine N-methyltransferase SETMAR